MENNAHHVKQLKRGLWKPEEDLILKNYVETHGEGNWATVSEKSGLRRGGKSCRLRWKNYLRPNIKRGEMSQDEQDLIIRMHKLLGNRWSLIAGRLPGRTDNEVKNYWNTHLNKKSSHLPHKRKSIVDFNHNGNNTNKKKCSSSRTRNAADQETLDTIRKQERNIDDVTDHTWTTDQDTITGTFFDYYDHHVEFGLVPQNNNASFVFDDEPLIAYLNSFVLFESAEYMDNGPSIC